ncbi:hypothetical protein ABIC65_003322 [Sphingomonas trueperi]
MVASVSTVAYLGLEARAVEVQCNLVAGLPKFVVVGTQDLVFLLMRRHLPIEVVLRFIAA